MVTIGPEAGDPEDLSHLHESTRRVARLPAAERLAHARADRWIGYTRAVQAVARLRVIHVSSPACKRLLREGSGIGGQLLRVLAQQIYALRRHCHFYASRAPLRERLCALLLELDGRHGRLIRDGVHEIDVKLSCELLGNMLDAHRATVTEEIAELRRHGLIAMHHQRVTILDENGLRELAEGVF